MALMASEETTLAPKITPSLPYELWMRVLESLTHEHTFTRRAYVNCFVEAIIKRTATEEELVAALPKFERRAWKATRPYYAISSSIRKAAQQVFLSGVLLQTCVAPLKEVPRQRKGKRVPKGMKCDGSLKPFYAPDVLAKTKARESEDGSGLVPTYLPLELFEMSVYRHITNFTEDCSLLRTVRNIELLAASPCEDSTEVDWEGAKRLKRHIQEVWEEMGVQDGEVQIMY
jgi:hypothetical protein